MSDIRIINGRQTERLIKPRAALAFGTLPESLGEKNVLYCIFTVGAAVSREIDRLMAEEKLDEAAALSEKADQSLFTFEKELLKRVRKICTEEGCGVRRRLEPGTALPIKVMEAAFRATDAATTLGMRLTTGLMLDPIKSECLIFELSEDVKEFHTAHDCGDCTAVGCRLREQLKREAKSGYGIAIDLGSTGLAFALISMQDGVVLASSSGINHQRKYGADVISRIRAAGMGKGDELRHLIEDDLKTGMDKLLSENRIPADHIERIAISGNTTMLHLLRGYDCAGLSAFPFSPVNLTEEHLHIPAIADQAEIILLPGISAFVGADIVAGLYALRSDRAKCPSLFVDLGTNSEMALITDDRILVTSTAAGSAFERIARRETKGIGTDIIAHMAELLQNGSVDATGLLLRQDPVFSQQDIRDIQLAKAAVRAGIETLLLRGSVSCSAIDRLYIAGTFGEKLDRGAASGIGLIPPELSDRVEAIGNASLCGTIRFLTDKKGSLRTQRIVALSEEISLADDSFFQEQYIGFLNF